MVTRTPEEIRSEVSKAYGNRVRGVLAADEALPLVDAANCCAPAATAEASSCCGTESASEDVSCCGVSDDQTIVTNVAQLYQQSDVSDLPSTVTDVLGSARPDSACYAAPNSP